jgi:hypothetical protein
MTFAGFVSYGGTPKSSKSLDSLDHFRTETHGNLGIPHFQKSETSIFIHILYQLGSEGAGN